MYKYHKPTPIVIKLTDEAGFEMRQKAADYLKENLNKKGAERGSTEEQGFGLLTEIVIRRMLGMAELNNDDHPLAYDVLPESPAAQPERFRRATGVRRGTQRQTSVVSCVCYSFRCDSFCLAGANLVSPAFLCVR